MADPQIKVIQEKHGANPPTDIYPKTSVDAVEGLKKYVLDLVYPVGSIYITTVVTDPSVTLGGTWEKYAEGRTIIGANATYPAGSTGGEATHKLTVDEMPSHGHSSVSSGSHTHSGSTQHPASWGDDDPGTTWEKAWYGYIKGGITENSDPQASGFANINKDWNAGDRVGYETSWQSKGVQMHIRHWHKLSIDNSGSHTHTINNTGNGANHNNMQPYIATYIWKRTA